jgi:hypothetical protein
MSEKSWMQKVLLLMFLIIVPMLSGTTAIWADEPSSFHVLFTGDVTAHLEPSG